MSRVLPILFNTEMVKAILEGRKTVTRRVVKHNTESLLNSPFCHKYPEVPKEQVIKKLCQAPYEVGDIIYVRETWNISNMWIEGNLITFIYRAGNEEKDAQTVSVSDEIFDKYGEAIAENNPEWRPSLHMPKAAARIWLKVTDVRVERLQDITNKDAKKEGVKVETDNSGVMHRMKFIDLWNSTIKKSDIDTYGWKANPWVWVIEFERCEKPNEGLAGCEA